MIKFVVYWSVESVHSTVGFEVELYSEDIALSFVSVLRRCGVDASVIGINAIIDGVRIANFDPDDGTWSGLGTDDCGHLSIQE